MEQRLNLSYKRGEKKKLKTIEELQYINGHSREHKIYATILNRRLEKETEDKGDCLETKIENESTSSDEQYLRVRKSEGNTDPQSGITMDSRQGA